MLPRGLGLLIIIGIAGCAGAGSPGCPIAFISIDSEALAGQRAAVPLEKRFGGVLNDPGTVQHLERIAERLAAQVEPPPIHWRLHLLAGEQVNAFSLPGGLIYITRGLYERVGHQDHLLAAVIAHEMAHVLRKDSLKPKPGSTTEALHRETSADRLGVSLLVAANYSPDSMKTLLGLISDVQPPGWARVRLEHLSETKSETTTPVGLLSAR